MNKWEICSDNENDNHEEYEYIEMEVKNDLAYDAIYELTKRGMEQINIHFLISEETYDRAFEIMDDIKSDPRLEKLNAIVFLSLKPKGRSVGHFHQLSQDKFNNLIEYAMEKNIAYGFDSCSCDKVNRYIDTKKGELDHLKSYTESCESTLYSLDIDVNGDFFPCSFSPDTEGWENGLSVLKCDNFLKDIWNHEKTKKFRKGVIKCRKCQGDCSLYDI